MLNKKGIAQIAIPAVVIALVVFGVRMYFIDLAFEAIEPGIEDILRQLEDKAICPPEFTSSDYKVCIGKNGEILVDGIINKEITLELDGGASCPIPIGSYQEQQICSLESFWRAEKAYLVGLGLFQKKSVQVSQLIKYTKAGKYISALRLAKNIPKI